MSPISNGASTSAPVLDRPAAPLPEPLAPAESEVADTLSDDDVLGPPPPGSPIRNGTKPLSGTTTTSTCRPRGPASVDAADGGAAVMPGG